MPPTSSTKAMTGKTPKKAIALDTFHGARGIKSGTSNTTQSTNVRSTRQRSVTG